MPISAGTEEPGAGHCFSSKTGISGPVWITVFLYSPDLKLQKEVRKDGACDKAAGVCSQTHGPSSLISAMAMKTPTSPKMAPDAPAETAKLSVVTVMLRGSNPFS